MRPSVNGNAPRRAAPPRRPPWAPRRRAGPSNCCLTVLSLLLSWCCLCSVTYFDCVFLVFVFVLRRMRARARARVCAFVRCGSKRARRDPMLTWKSHRSPLREHFSFQANMATFLLWTIQRADARARARARGDSRDNWGTGGRGMLKGVLVDRNRKRHPDGRVTFF